MRTTGKDALFSNEGNLFPWTSAMTDLKKERNVFETRVTEYQKGLYRAPSDLMNLFKSFRNFVVSTFPFYIHGYLPTVANRVTPSKISIWKLLTCKR